MSRGISNAQRVMEFNVQLDQYRDRVADRLDQFCREFLMRLCEAIIVGNQYGPGTPVKSGFARANWTIGINTEAPGGASRNPNPTGTFDGGAAAAEQLQKLIDFKAGDFLNLANNAVYAYRLETGHSQQAPAGMVRVAVAAAPTIANDIMREMGV